MQIIFILLSLLLTTRMAAAHEGGAIPADVWGHWNTNPLILIGLLLPAYLYLRGAATYPVTWMRTAAFIGGIAAVFIALISPVDAMTGSLFSVHMAQHLLLMVVAAPLFVLSRPLAPLLRGLPHNWRKVSGQFAQRSWAQKFWRKLTQPITILLLHLAAIWLWHIPGFYSAAINNPFFHILEHASFFITALLYWWMLRDTDEYGRRILSVFGVMMTSGLLGALMTFATTPWYVDHAAYVSAWGLTLLEDQQLAGLSMWIPGGFVYVVTAALLLGAWLNAVEQRAIEREQRQQMKEIGDA